MSKNLKKPWKIFKKYFAGLKKKFNKTSFKK